MGEKGRKRDNREQTALNGAESDRESDREREESCCEVGQLVLAEIRKTFTVISSRVSSSSSKDGLDTKGIEEVLKAIVQNPLTQSEQQQFLKHLKIEEKGEVNYEEFLPVLLKFLHDGFSCEGGNKRRKLVDSAEGHEEMHKKIKGFVYNFETSTQNEEIRKRMNNFGMGDINILLDEDTLGDTLSSEAKMEFLKKCKIAIEEDADSIVFGLKSGQLEHLLPSVRKLYELLRIVEVFPTPTQRRRVAEDVLRVYSLILTQGIVEPLVKCLYLQHSELQHLSLCCLRLIAPGPDIASTPNDHILHPNKIFFKRSIYTQNAFAVVVDFLNGPSTQLCNDALSFISSFSLHHPESRDVVLQHSSLPSILSLCSLSPLSPSSSPSRPPSPHRQFLYPLSLPPPPATNDSDLLRVVRTLSIVLGASHSVSKLPPWSVISTAVPVIGSLLFADEPSILIPVLAAARVLFPGVPDSILRFRLLQLLTSHPSPKVTKATLHTFDGIFKYDKQHSEILIKNCNIITILHDLLSSSRETMVQLAACDTLAIVAQFYPDAVKGETIPMVLKRISDSADSTKTTTHLIGILKRFVKGPQSLTDFLVGQDSVKILCKTLDLVKYFNTMTVKDAATNNFELANEIIETLEILVYTGEANIDNSINKVALTFDVESVGKIYSLFSKINEGMQQYKYLFEFWDKNGIKKPTQVIEERAKYILRLILKAHEASKQSSEESQKVCEFINSHTYKIHPSSSSFEDKVLLSCTYNGDTRVISTPVDITLPYLKSIIEQKYEILRPALMYQHTEEGRDNVSVDSKETLHDILTKSKSNNAKSLKFNITVTPPTPQPRKTAPQTPTKSLHANLTPTLSPNSPFQKSSLAPLLTPLDLDSVSMDIHNLEIIRGQERKALLESLLQTTNFGHKEIEALYNEWKSPKETEETEETKETKKSVEEGYIQLETFITGLKNIGQKDPLVLESFCRSFDTDNDGKIYYRQFIVSLSVLLQSAILEDKLKFVFQVCDRSNKGKINKPEFIEIVKSALIARNQLMNNQEFNQGIEECFVSSKEKQLSFEEFSAAIMLQPHFVVLFISPIPGLSF